MLPETVYLHIVSPKNRHPPTSSSSGATLPPEPSSSCFKFCYLFLLTNLSRIWWPDCLDVASKRVPPLRKHITWKPWRLNPTTLPHSHSLLQQALLAQVHFPPDLTIWYPFFEPFFSQFFTHLYNGSINKALFGDMLLLHLEKSEEVSQEIVHWIAFTSRKHLRFIRRCNFHQKVCQKVESSQWMSWMNC